MWTGAPVASGLAARNFEGHYQESSRKIYYRIELRPPLNTDPFHVKRQRAADGHWDGSLERH